MKQRELVNCSACGSDNYDPYEVKLNDWIKGDYTYAKCNACGFVYVNPRPLIEEVEEIYTAHTNPFDQEEYEGMEVEAPTLNRLIRRIEKIVPKGKILDMGCGRGDFLKIAKDRGYDVQGSDLSTADGPYPDIPIFKGFLQDANFASESFDVIVTRNTLEHIFDPNEDLRELNRILKPGGLLYVKVPHVKYEEGWRCKAFFGFDSLFTPPVHLNHFGTFTLRRILERNGFEFISWESEKPSRTKNKFKNAVLSTGYAAIDAVKTATLGNLFPKPVLSVMVRKAGEPMTKPVVSIPLQETSPVAVPLSETTSDLVERLPEVHEQKSVG
ncbi:MAG TPA: class I SAM-dependent methyltransferase [Bacteroidetes bacterium]|nr:class I SAM-dependent methyltransferase [Bacteroidota bacterium]